MPSSGSKSTLWIVLGGIVAVVGLWIYVVMNDNMESWSARNPVSVHALGGPEPLPSGLKAVPAKSSHAPDFPARMVGHSDDAPLPRIDNGQVASGGNGTGGGRAEMTAHGRVGEPPPNREQDTPEERAALDKSDIQSVIRDLKPQFIDCYQQGLNQKPDLAGKVTNGFTLKRDVIMGSVPDDGSIEDSTLGAPLVEACILDKLRNAKFPEMKGKGTVSVRYPLMFANDADAGAPPTPP
ncbi:MAG: AgmX/PglI C-terminal domain-containing protein [Deltaproteobacteria bacterium]|nr:AgmX/PglI C-terminal domain-containing protein [Deltaproteobacteria bacterium]